MENIVYSDYANWLIENDDLLRRLKKENSFLYKRYKHVLDVVNYLYNMKIETDTLTEEETNIFGVGFYYLFEQYDQISLLLEYSYNGDLKELEKQQKTIELLLDAIEFQNDIYSMLDEPELVQDFLELEQDIFSYIEKKSPAPDELFEKLNQVSIRVYEENELDFYPIKEIFYDIAEEFNLI